VRDQVKSPPQAAAPSLVDWLLMLFPAAMLLVLLLRHVWDVDIFWQLKLGELILDRGGPVLREPFAASHLDEPLAGVAWLGQAAMAAVRRLGGWNALRVFDALCWLGGFWAVAAACRARGAAAPGVVMALLLPFMAALPTASIRPQRFAALCLGLLLALLRLELRPLTTVALAVPLLVLWQNLHPSVSVALVVLGVTAAADWYRRWRGQGAAPVAATMLVPLAALAIFATPDGFSILAVSARNAQASMAIGASEWLPLWIAANRTNAVPVVVVAVLTLYMAMKRPRRIDLAEAAVALSLFVMVLLTYRFVLFWAVAMVPVIARLATADEAAQTHGLSRWLAPLTVGLVAVLTPLAAPTRFSDTLPMEAIARLKLQDVHGVIYADFPYGGPIIDAGYPDWRVAYDGRYYRYTSEEWHFNGDIEGGHKGLRDILAKWRVAAFLLKSSHNGPLAAELSRNPDWRRVWTDGDVVVYVRR